MPIKHPTNVFSQASAHSPVNLEHEEKIILDLFRQQRWQEAEHASRFLTTRAPAHGFGWKALGLVLSIQGRKQEALPAMQQAAKLLPNDAEAFNNLAALFIELGQLKHAEACLQHSLGLSPNALAILDKLIEILQGQDRQAELLPLLERKLALTPEDDGLRHQVAMLSGQQTDAAPATYVQHLFNEYAEQFDDHLQNTLAYKAPTELVELMSGLIDSRETLRVLDLGCGTGLVAQALQPRRVEITGVDLSEKMLEKARARNLYARLYNEDVLARMKAEPNACQDIITSADVFIYVGKLDEVVAQAARLLVSGGVFAFSVEDLTKMSSAASQADLDRGYRLESSGRYSHAPAYLERLADLHGFTISAHKATALRRDKSGEILGLLSVWQKQT
jgi:predicted TPR repeat methyltransferase